MKKPRTRAFRRNRRRNTRKIKGGDPTMDLLLRLPNLLKSKVDDETKLRVTNGVNGEMAKLAHGGIKGSLIKTQYIIRRKMRNNACGKTRFHSYGKKTEECDKAIADMDELKKSDGKDILSYANRIKLSHKRIGGISSSLLSYILISSMRMYENDKLHAIVKLCLQLFFTDAELKFDRLTEDDRALLLTFDKVSIRPEDKKEAEQSFNEISKDEEEQIIGPTSVLPDITYEVFKDILGTQTETITREEFEALKIIYINKFESGKTTGGGDLYKYIDYDEGDYVRMLQVFILCGISNILALPINILWAFFINQNQVAWKWRIPTSTPDF